MVSNLRKRKHKEISMAPSIQLKPLEGAQIEAVTKTYNDLREVGVDNVVQLPATIVAGDTSSGKSSVMCRLTGLPFPCGEGVVTKFATEVDMMPADVEEIRVTIRPDKGRSQDQQDSLLRFSRTIDLGRFEDTFTEACMLMSHLGGRTLYADILHISLKGPLCKPLTVIDLPGLIHAATQKVSEADRKLSEILADRYVRHHPITRKHDKCGTRTMGIVTKVDTVCGKAKDTQLMNILSNQEIPLKLGWHALVNTIESNEDATDEQITKAEQEFFKAARFKAIDKSTTGIDNLRARVVQVVGEKLVDTLPALHQEVLKKLEDAESALYALGQPIAEFEQQRKALNRVCSLFTETAQVQMLGAQSSSRPVGESSDTTTTENSTLRAAIEGFQHDFARAMLAYGGTKRFRSLGASSFHSTNSHNVYEHWSEGTVATERQAALVWVKATQQASSRSTMSGSGNDEVATELCRELSSRWGQLAQEHIENISRMCKRTISQNILNRSTEYDSRVADHIKSTWIDPYLDTKLQEALDTLADLEKSMFATLKTYSPRLETLAEEKLGEVYALDSYLKQITNSKTTAAVNNLANELAHYEIDLEYWVTAVIKQAAEPFVRSVPKALPSDMVFDLSKEEIKTVMTEPEDLAVERAEVEHTVKTLKFALGKLEGQLKCLRPG